jgi:hypothetical protein
VHSECLFTTLTRAPAHFPEFNFEPRGFLEDRDQLGLANLCRMEFSESTTVFGRGDVRVLVNTERPAARPHQQKDRPGRPVTVLFLSIL